MRRTNRTQCRAAKHAVMALACCVCAPRLSAQVVLNEIFENPPGQREQEIGWEYIELYGAPGTPLDGMAVLVLKGGRDDDRDGIPELLPHLDEVLVLDGCTLSDEGFFTLVGTDDNGRSAARIRCHDFSSASTVDEHVRLFPETFPSQASDRSISSRLDNQGSSTYLLVRIDPEDPARKNLVPGAQIDTDFDGELDELLTIGSDKLAWPNLQVLDEIAWSHQAGHEYTILSENEISETAGLNPDAVSRVRYYPGNPLRGHRTKDVVSSDGRIVGFEVRSTTTADESFLFGVLNTELFPELLVYFDGYDLDGWDQLRGPTDRARTPYSSLPSDPEPDRDPFPALIPRDPDGTLFFDDIRPRGFSLTPGTFNDSQSDSIFQARFIPGDIDFDGHVDQRDAELARALLGAGLGDLVQTEQGRRYRWQCGAAQQIMAIKALNGDRSLLQPISVEHVRSIESLLMSNEE